jgi:3-deoxy-7-phosphoheptulonate synthase
VSEHCRPAELLQALDVLNPHNIPGRVTVITRMGAATLRAHLPGLIRAVQREGRSVVWVCDPMHGNTIKTEDGYKTRPFERILEEVRAFFEVHREMGSHPGGVHLEMTGQDVTECLGGQAAGGVRPQDLGSRYATLCDPRLNGHQSVEVAVAVAERLRGAKGGLMGYAL